MDKVLVVFNPHASRGRAYKRTAHVQEALEAAGFPFETVISEERGHGIELARRAALAGRELVVAAGGDGTINEVVNGLMQADGGDGCLLGVLPVGSGNDFAGALGIPLDLHKAALRLKERRVRRVDVGCVNGRYFDNNVGMAFEARVAIEAHKLTWLSGQTQYMTAIFRSLASYPLPTVDVELDDLTLPNKPVLMISVCNNRRIGGGIPATPDAEPDDGLLDVVVADAMSRLRILRLLPKVLKGKHPGEPGVLLTRTTRLVVESQDPLPVHADGEVLWNDAHRVEISLLPARLQVVV